MDEKRKGWPVKVWLPVLIVIGAILVIWLAGFPTGPGLR